MKYFYNATCCFYLIGILLALSFGKVYGQTKWRELQTVKDVYAVFPERLDSLLTKLDLNVSGFQKVREAVNRGDAVAACEELLNYYRAGETGKFLRREQPVSSSQKDPEADSIAGNIFTFYETPAKVPRLADGHLDWSYRGPANDIEWAWALNRHYHLQILLNSYFETGNPLYAKTIDAHIRDWVISSLPYPGVKSSTALWRGLEVSFRAKVWARVFFALINSELLSPATEILLLSSLPDHCHYLKNFHATEGNWLTMEMSGLAMAATAWPEFKASPQWIAYSKNQMEEGLKDQVYPDGVQKELTSMYHQVALNNFSLFSEICQEARESLPAGYQTELEKMHNYIAYSVRPTGYGILNNDADKKYNRDLITAAASAYEREDWLFIASNGKKGKRPEGSPSVVFPWAGQLVMRSGYDADAQWAFFDIGPWGSGHQHNDKLHISLSAYGRDLLVDGGRFAYRGELADKFRGYATGSASHNVVLLDGKGQGPGPRIATQKLSDEQYRITDRFDYAWSSFDNFRDLEGVGKHTRALFYVRGKFWIVVDRIDTDRPRKVETLWHWHPDVKVRSEENGVVSTDQERGNLHVIPVGFSGWNIKQVSGQESPSPQGWYSERYNKSQPNVASIYSTEIKASTSFVWVLYPSEGKIPAPETEIISRDNEKVVVRVKDARSNQWDVTVPFSGSAESTYTFRSFLGAFVEPGYVGAHDRGEIRKLLSRIDLNTPGLEKVKAAVDEPERAATELLSFYRSRDFVKHPVDRSQKAGMRGKYATEKDMQVAGNALKHIFVGQGAYPPYYCGDDIDWGLRPVPDNEWVWQLNRMSFWDAMGKAYWHTGDEQYAREWCMQLMDWTQKNPNDTGHAYAWRSIEGGIRGHVWTTHFQRFVDAPSFTPAVLVAFLNNCYDHAEYLMTKYRKGSNWGLMEAEGLGFIGFTFPEFVYAKKWRHEAIGRLNAEMENQVYADGHQRELAIGYHMGCIGWFKRTLDLAAMNGQRDAFPASYLQKIEKMCEVPFKLGFPDGTTTQFGDSWTGSPGHLRPALKEWSAIFGREDFLYVATEGKEGTKPDQTAFALEKSGFYSIRSGWDKEAIAFVLKCGPDGGGHCQPDNGTFELYASGRHLMPDAGSYIYSGDPENRAWFRQTKVHQTVTLNGENSAYQPKQLLWRPGKDLDVLVVENASYPNLTHRRAVFFVNKKYFVIVDEAIGKGAGDVDLHFQLGPGSAVYDNEKLSARSDFRDGWNVLVQSMDQKGLQLKEEEGWVSFEYTKKERRPAFCYNVKKQPDENIRFITIVAPYEGSNPPKIEARLVGKPMVGSAKMELKVTADGSSRKIKWKIAEP